MKSSLVNDDPIIHRLFGALNSLTKGHTQPWAEMFSPTGVMEFPYAPPGYPQCLEGKAAIAAYIESYPTHIALHNITLDNLYRSGDTRIVEFRVEATAVASGRPFSMRYVAIIKVEDGLICTYRDYWNPLKALEAMGGLDAITSMGRTQ